MNSLDQLLDPVHIVQDAVLVVVAQVASHPEALFVVEVRLGLVQVANHLRVRLGPDLAVLVRLANFPCVWVDDLSGKRNKRFNIFFVGPSFGPRIGPSFYQSVK